MSVRAFDIGFGQGVTYLLDLVGQEFAKCARDDPLAQQRREGGKGGPQFFWNARCKRQRPGTDISLLGSPDRHLRRVEPEHPNAGATQRYGRQRRTSTEARDNTDPAVTSTTSQGPRAPGWWRRAWLLKSMCDACDEDTTHVDSYVANMSCVSRLVRLGEWRTAKNHRISDQIC